MIGFVNTRTGARTQQLKGFPTESENETVARMKAAGWEINSGEYEYDESNQTLTYKEKAVKTEAKDAEGQKEGGDDADPQTE